MIYINNEMPLYIHEVRALTRVAVLRLLELQPESHDGLNRIDLTHTFLNKDCRSALLDMFSDLFYYFDDHARDTLGIDFPTYRDHAHKLLVYFKEDLDTIGTMSRDLIVASADLFIAGLRIIRMLFNIEYTLTTAVAHSSPEEGDYAFLPTGLQNVLSKILDRLNEMYFNGKSQYLAHTGDIGINHRRGIPGGICMHSGYLLAHHSLSDRGRLYDESMSTLCETNDNMSLTRSCYMDVEKIPIILDNSAFELGASASPAKLIEWYSDLTSQGFLDNEMYEYVPVLPDVLGDHLATLKLSEEFLRKTLEIQIGGTADVKPFAPNAEVNFMVVVQDSKPPEGEILSTNSIIDRRIKNLEDMVAMVIVNFIKMNHLTSLSQPIAVWAGMPMMRYSPNGDLLFDRSGGEIRAMALNKIADTLVDIKKRICKKANKVLPSDMSIESGELVLRFHILGCISPAEYKFLTKDATKIVDSLDTSFPFSTAINQEEAFILSKQQTASGGVPSRPWHIGRKMRLRDAKPFTMTLLPPQISDPLPNYDVDGGIASSSYKYREDEDTRETAMAISEATRINAVRFSVYQLDMWVGRLRHMAINQRMFEEWVGSVWSDSV